MTPNRRTVLQGGLACAAALAAGTDGAATWAEPAARPPLAIGAGLDCDAEGLGRAADDFGHIIHKRPRAVLRPASAADIARAIRWAASAGWKVAARGQGHSTYGRAMVDGGLVIDMSTIGRIHHIAQDRIVVDAGATWRAVLDAALSKGLTPPVLTNYLGLSVGGALAVGGIGGATSRYGMQTDNVFELDVVTGDGRELACSVDRNSDLFNAVLGGLGQCAIITRATLRLTRAPERVRRFQLFYPDLGSLIHDQRLVLAEGRFDQLQGAVLPDPAGGWRRQLDGAVFYNGSSAPQEQLILAGLSDDRAAAVISDLTYAEDAKAFDRFEDLLRANGQWFNPHPWLLTFLRGSNAEQLAAEILQGLTHEDVGPFGRITCYPMRTDGLRTPLVRTPDESIAFPFNIIRIPASSDSAKVKRMIADNRTLYERVRIGGGLLYPVSAFPMSAQDWKDHFGAAWPLLYEAKERHDPRRILAPGYEIF